MVNKKFCDVCKQEITSFMRIYTISYGEKNSFGGLFGKHSKKGEVCEDCIKKIDSLINSLKK